MAKSLGVPEIPDGAFDFYTNPEGASLDLLPQWVGEAGPAAWGQILDADDAFALGDRIAKVVGGQVAKTAGIAAGAALTAKAGAAAAASGLASLGAASAGAAVSAAVPIIGWAAGAIAFFAAAIAQAAKGIEYNLDRQRNQDREWFLNSQRGFNPGAALSVLFPIIGDDSDLFSPRSAVWLPRTFTWSSGVVPPNRVFEITPAFYPAWNPYTLPAPYKPAKGVDSEINDILIGWQQDAWADPRTIALIPEANIKKVNARLTALRAGSTLSWQGKGSPRKIEQDELNLLRKCLGNVIAARAALLENPELCRLIGADPKDSPDVVAAASRSTIGTSVIQSALENLPPSKSGIVIDHAALADAMKPKGSGGGLLLLGAAAVAAGAYAMSRKRK